MRTVQTDFHNNFMTISLTEFRNYDVDKKTLKPAITDTAELAQNTKNTIAIFEAGLPFNHRMMP